MTDRQAIKVVKNYQSWRRGEIDDLSESPFSIGKAIDRVIELAEMQLIKKSFKK